MKVDIIFAKKEASRLHEIFGELALAVVDELIAASEAGYDYDSSFEIPLYNEIKRHLLPVTGLINTSDDRLMSVNHEGQSLLDLSKVELIGLSGFKCSHKIYVGNSLDHRIKLHKNVRFYRCCFDSLIIDDSDVKNDVFEGCYFERVTFTSGREIHGVNNCAHYEVK